MLKKEYRLKRRQDFRQVYQRGKTLKNRAFVLCYRPARNGNLRIGFSVSKKIGKAVERNRVRRLLQEACQLEMMSFPSGYDFVLIARLGAKGESMESLRRRVSEILKLVPERKTHKN